MPYGNQESAFKGLDSKHTNSLWRGAKAGADETNALDDTLTAFQIDSGNETWGTALCIVGSGDTPIRAGNTLFEICHIAFAEAEQSNFYKIRIAWGDTYAEAITAGNFSEKMVNPDAVPSSPIDFHMERVAVGVKVWAACWVDDNTGTLDFFIAIQEINL